MKRALFSLAAFCAGTATAQAQSSLVLYGVADANIEYVTNMSRTTPLQPGFPSQAGNRFALNSGGLSGSRWGLRGLEDLGQGLKAVYVLESGFGVDDGKLTGGGRLFGRQAYVGLQSEQIGRFTFGRQYTAIFDAFANFSPTRYGSQYEPIVAQLGLDYRSDNTAKYTGSFGPVTASAHWSFGNGVAGAGEVPGQFRRDTGYGGSLTYLAGAFGAALAYGQFNPTLTTAGGTGTFRKAGAAVSYAVGPAKIMGGYRWGKNEGVGATTVLRDDYYWIGANYDATSALGLTLAYYYDNVRSLAGQNIKNPWQVSFIANYKLSARTDMYLTTAYTKNAGLNFDTSAISFANGYFPGAGKDNMLGAAVGVRHRF
ncbi:porin [Cupriavidus basilensis]